MPCSEFESSIISNGEETDIGEINSHEILDPNCVATKPYRVTFQDITSAAFLIKSGIEYTPCTVSKINEYILIV